MVPPRAVNPTRLCPRSVLRRMGPWTVSIVFHVLLVVIGLMVTWSILHEDDRLPSPLVTSDIVAMTPLVPLRESPLMEHTAVAPIIEP